MRIMRNLVLTEVSHVGDPANPQSTVALWKRADGAPRGDEQMTLEELKKQLADATSERDALTKAIEAAGLRLTKSADGVKVEKPAEKEYVDVDGQKVEKSLVPAPVLAVLEKQARDLEALKKAAETETFAKRADAEIPNIAGSREHRAALLKSVESIADEAARAEVLKSLKSVDAILAKSQKEIGSGNASGDGESTPQELLKKGAEALAKEKNLDFHSAYAEYTKSADGKKLMAQAMNSR